MTPLTGACAYIRVEAHVHLEAHAPKRAIIRCKLDCTVVDISDDVVGYIYSLLERVIREFEVIVTTSELVPVAKSALVPAGVVAEV